MKRQFTEKKTKIQNKRKIANVFKYVITKNNTYYRKKQGKMNAKNTEKIKIQEKTR